ncbi:hypothetical protein MASR1M90_16470 [Desulfovibrionales bacterium]
MSLDLLLTGLVVIGAALYLVRILRRQRSGGCCGCANPCQSSDLGDLRPSDSTTCPGRDLDQ